MIHQKQLKQEFARQFGAAAAMVVRAPGRVNLIGEHTDYNDGFVLPMAIDRAIWIALRPRDDREVRLTSLDMGETAVFHLDHLQQSAAGWAEYVKGMAFTLQRAGYRLRGWEGVMSGDVPIGAGLSSSAALEMAVARAFTAVSDLPWDAKRMAQLGQQAENEWVGVNCGIMDQMVCAAGRAGHALLIDCRSLDVEAVPLPPQTAVIVLDTATRRGLADSAYNERRKQCETAAAFFGVPALRDVSAVEFATGADDLDPLVRRRARHVIHENERTLQAAEAMKRGDAGTLGRLMDASHASLRDDFQVSSRELDEMVAIARRQWGCFGARMTGAGFGGCAVALVQADVAEVWATAVAREYQAATQITPAVYPCQAAEGAHVTK